ncbi:MAG TPA: TatD family hydrolase [Methanothermobacter sp.]|nr:TatD-related deoxyribonuclease [Methanothermobacter sp. MT-2]HHW05649.1 hypothetical protein [Methanothermobacter sp.]HOK73405.1 TatD family hydrolase [Methanothermobacter sp.]HOL69489.1 TatD family hydrolase [Methanothermobacter sp.]HOQ20656.1 TatD family hydrolase [Methanothermobacter sp.]
MIDSHIHADTRPYEDFEKMAIAGINKTITCAHDPLPMKVSAVNLEHIQRLLEIDTQRAKENGLKLYVAVGIHPRSIPRDYKRVIEKLPQIIEDRKVVAIGEIGIEKGNQLEIKVLKEQLKLADEMKIPVIIHTPRKNKKEITRILIQIIEDNINTSQVIIDHVNTEIIDEVINKDPMLGLTIQPGKMTPFEAVMIMREYDIDKFMLNSDMSSAPSDPLSVPKTAHIMRIEGFSDSEIRKVSSKNAEKFFKI